jgi:diguanylate cyclase (GGDEF)-like protein/PAS domain S-box-containing protein
MDIEKGLVAIARRLVTQFARIVRPLRARLIERTERESPEESAARYARLALNSLDTIVELSADGSFLWVSPNVYDVFGYHAVELAGRSAFDYVHPDDTDRVFEIFTTAIASGKPAEATFRFRHGNGSWRWVESRGKSFFHNAAPRMSVFTRDITQTVAQQHRLVHVAHHDHLTGLPNRVLFEDRLEQAIAAAGRSGDCVGVLFIDLDHFKKINDSFGHLVGDRVLKTVAQRLAQNLRVGDTVTRLGGDEFVLILTGLHRAADCSRVARGAHTLFHRPVAVDNQLLRVTASIGLAVWPRDGKTGQDLLAAADKALYRAKESGRNRFIEYLPMPEKTPRAIHGAIPGDGA